MYFLKMKLWRYSDTAGKVEDETQQQMNNLIQRLCSVLSFLLSRKLH